MCTDSEVRFAKSYHKLDFVDQDIMRAHPKNAPIFTRRRLQRDYNPKTRYLEI